MSYRDNSLPILTAICILIGILIGFFLGYFLRGDAPLIEILHGSDAKLEFNIADAVTLSTIIGFGFSILIFLWRLYRDFLDLSGRVSKLEGRRDEEERQQELGLVASLRSNPVKGQKD